MYYPYLRGKQFELILLRDYAEFIAKNKIHPILEPVKISFSMLTRAVNALEEKGAQYTLIINPSAGQIPVPTSKILNELIDSTFKEYNSLSIGYILNARSNINSLVELLDKYKNLKFSIVHYGYTDANSIVNIIKGHNNIKTHIFIEGFAGKLYQRNLKKDGIDRVLIRDGFKLREKNADYPPREHFSDLHITFADEGMNGFGDFLIVGGNYAETGGPAYAVAIHLTYLKSDDSDNMYIYHFVSNQTESQVDPGGKFFEALAKLVKESSKTNSPIYKSKACGEYIELFKKKHYPGLGYVKKLSMQHHIELIAYFLNKAK